MIEWILISIIITFAALHLVLKLLPITIEQKLRVTMAAGLRKIGFHSAATGLVSAKQATSQGCRSGCERCGIKAVGHESRLDGGAKVIQFHPRP
jgi:hypothetical protein